MKSVFAEGDADVHSKASRSTPKEFRKAALNIISALREQLNENEVRAMGANPVASPVLQVSVIPCVSQDQPDAFR